MSENEPLLERIYTIPLRRAYYVPRKKRANKAIRLIREFVKRHLHVTEVKISQELNEYIWSRNCEKPPRKVKVIVKKIDEDTATVDLYKEEKRESR